MGRRGHTKRKLDGKRAQVLSCIAVVIVNGKMKSDCFVEVQALERREGEKEGEK